MDARHVVDSAPAAVSRGESRGWKIDRDWMATGTEPTTCRRRDEQVCGGAVLSALHRGYAASRLSGRVLAVARLGERAGSELVEATAAVLAAI